MHPKASTTQPQDLEAAISAIYASAQVIYFNFEIVFKLLALMLMAYIMYKLGRLSVSEPIARKVTLINRKITKYEAEKQGLASRIKRVSRLYNKFIYLFLILALGFSVSLYTQRMPIKMEITYVAPFYAIPLILYTIKLIHTSSFSNKSKKFGAMQQSILQSVKQINESFGPKVQAQLKSILCREKLSAKQNSPSHLCTKKQCQESRQLLRAKYETTKNLAESALQFEWCSTCKGRKPFDQLLAFRANPMAATDGTLSEEQDADKKADYLVENLEEMEKWIQQAGPCNCSKLYMEQILKHKKNANRILKQINARLQQRRVVSLEKSSTITTTPIASSSKVQSVKGV